MSKCIIGNPAHRLPDRHREVASAQRHAPIRSSSHAYAMSVRRFSGACFNQTATLCALARGEKAMPQINCRHSQTQRSPRSRTSSWWNIPPTTAMHWTRHVTPTTWAHQVLPTLPHGHPRLPLRRQLNDIATTPLQCRTLPHRLIPLLRNVSWRQEPAAANLEQKVVGPLRQIRRIHNVVHHCPKLLHRRHRGHRPQPLLPTRL